MVFVNRNIRIGTHPSNRNLVLEILNIYGATDPEIRYFRTMIDGKEVAKCYFYATIDSDELKNLIKHLDKLPIISTITF